MRAPAFMTGILLCSAAAFGQATVEGALTHALSTTTGTAMGKALGNVTNQMATRVTGQLGQQTPHAVPKSKVQSTKPAAKNSAQDPDIAPSYGTTADPPAGGSLIASIQGAKLQPACDSAAKDSPDKPADSISKPPACPATTDTHPSEITLGAPQ